MSVNLDCVTNDRSDFFLAAVQIELHSGDILKLIKVLDLIGVSSGSDNLLTLCAELMNELSAEPSRCASDKENVL